MSLTPKQSSYLDELLDRIEANGKKAELIQIELEAAYDNLQKNLIKVKTELPKIISEALFKCAK